MVDGSDVERAADAGHHATADQAGLLERQFLLHHDRLLRRHDAVLGERAKIHQMLQLAAVLQLRAASAIELHRKRTLTQIILAEDRQVAVAIKAMGEMRVPREDELDPRA